MKLEAGEQRGECEGDGRAILRWSGIVSSSDTDALLAQLREACAGAARLRVVCDLTQVQLMPSDARRALLGLATLPIERIAVVAPDFTLRVVVTMVLSVVELELKRDNLYQFCASEAEAWSWLEREGGGSGARAEEVQP